jgi:type I restriction enzyme, S subunit
MTITRYEKYKPSGIEWLGDVPEHWEVKRNKSVFNEIVKLSKDGSETLLTVSHITGVTPRSEKNVNMFFAETMEGYKLCSQGDLVINTMWAWMGALGTSRYEGICSPAYNVYRNIKGVGYNHQYFDCLFRIPNFVIEMTRYSKGIVESRLRLYPKDFFRIFTCLPPLHEQTAIAHYLDTQTAAIDAKIALLAQKIDKYKELSKSLINETVCRGLDKNAPMKESGIEWIGKIPKHWEVKRLKDIGFLYSGLSGKSGEDFNQEATDNSRYYIPFTNIANNKYIDHNDFRTVTFEAGEKQNEVTKNDIFFLMSSEGYADIGKSAILIEEVNDVYLNSFCKGFRITNQAVFPIYLNYILNAVAFRNRFVVEGKGFTRINLKMEKVNDFNFIIPPISEQTAIATYLDQQTGKIAAIVTNLGLQIEGLKALRKTLINDVVTGKVKVV